MADGTPNKVILMGVNGKNFTFDSVDAVSKYLKCSRSTVTSYIKSGKELKNYFVDYLYTGSMR